MAQLSLSIITITYRAAEALEKTILSLLGAFESHSGFTIEFVIVDSSPEVTKPVIHKFSSRFRGISFVYVEQAPQGIYEAMNFGVRSSGGELLWFLNSGDELQSAQVLQSVMAEVALHPQAEVFCAAVSRMEHEQLQYVQRAPRTLKQGIWGTNRFCHQACLFRRSSFEGAGPYNTTYRLAADYALMVELWLRDACYVPLPQALVCFDLGGASSQVDPVLLEFQLITNNAASRLPASKRAFFLLSERMCSATIRLKKQFRRISTLNTVREAVFWAKRHLKIR